MLSDVDGSTNHFQFARLLNVILGGERQETTCWSDGRNLSAKVACSGQRGKKENSMEGLRLLKKGLQSQTVGPDRCLDSWRACKGVEEAAETFFL